MQSKDISTMSSYLMMLYVTLEQESALKNFFLGQGWTFCKPDLSVTTDKLGPSTLKQIGQNQLEPYLETPVAPIYNKKRKPKSSKSKETPPLKQQKSAQKQQSNDELEEVGNVVEGEAVGSEAKETRLGQSSGADNRPGSSRSVVLEDGREVTVKIEADFSESDNNEDGESELKDNDDDVNDHLDDENDETDVDYNFLEEGEIRLKNEDMSLPAGSQSGESSLLDHLHADSTEDQSMLEDSVNNETKVEDGAKIKNTEQSESDEADVVCDVGEESSSDRLSGWYNCRVCNKKFQTQWGLKRHIPIHSSIKFQCNICGKEYHNKYLLKQHIQIHMQDQNLCSACGKSFSRPDSLIAHERLKHFGNSMYACKLCSKQCSSKEVLNAHMFKHTNKATPHVCSKCNKHFMYRGTLARHIVKCGTVKKKIGDFVCSICEKHFGNKKFLHQHMITHNAPRNACHKCGKQFRWKTSLKRHIQNVCK